MQFSSVNAVNLFKQPLAKNTGGKANDKLRGFSSVLVPKVGHKKEYQIVSYCGLATIGNQLPVH